MPPPPTPTPTTHHHRQHHRHNINNDTIIMTSIVVDIHSADIIHFILQDLHRLSVFAWSPRGGVNTQHIHANCSILEYNNTHCKKQMAADIGPEAVQNAYIHRLVYYVLTKRMDDRCGKDKSLPLLL